MDKVVQKSSIQINFEDFGNNDFKRLSREIGRSLNQHPSPIAASTFRDYRYMYIRKINCPFRVEGEKISVLTQFIGEGHWDTFLAKHSASLNQVYSKSLFRSGNIYAMIDGPKGTSSDQLLIHKDPKNPEHLFNLSVHLLMVGDYDWAVNLLENAARHAPSKSRIRHFLALALLRGKRPFRHNKLTIDRLMKNLDNALTISPGREDSICLQWLVYKDFFERIGYRHKRPLPFKQNVDMRALNLISQCAGISTEEAELILQ